MAKTIHLPILIEQDEDQFYIVSCPQFKGCHAYGRTIEEAIANIHQVIEICLEEENYKPENVFIGFRELEFAVA